MDEKARLTAELICRLIHYLNSNRDTDTLRGLIAILMAAQVSVPMTVSMEEADLEKFLQAKVGDTVMTGSEVRMKPDLLKNSDGALFFPAFTTVEETPEHYRNAISWITMDFMNCVHNAYHNESCSGVVINGFSESFVVNRPLMKLMLDIEGERSKADEKERP